MRVDPRILLVVEHGDETTAPIFARYAEVHELGWQLTVLDHLHWQEHGTAMAGDGYAGLAGWHVDSLPDTWADRCPVTVAVGSRGFRPDTTLVDFDRAAIGRLAARHYRDQGFGAVATVRPWNNPVRADTFGPFLEEAERLGLRTLRHEPPGKRDRTLRGAVLAAWLRTTPRPLGVLIHQDRDAIDFLNFCLDRGLRVPDDVGILGVDDIPTCASLRPTLSSIGYPRARMAEIMALRLHRLLAGAGADGADGRILVPPLRVTTRASTTLVRSGDRVVDAIRRRIARSPGGAHDLPTLARTAGLSASQLHRRFRAAWGTTPGEWLARCRLSLAKDLLAGTDLTVAAVARRCGLGTASGLRQLFRRVGLPGPMRWRTLARGRVDTGAPS